MQVAVADDENSLATLLAAAKIIDGAPRTLEDLVPATRAKLIEVDGRGECGAATRTAVGGRPRPPLRRARALSPTLDARRRAHARELRRRRTRALRAADAEQNAELLHTLDAYPNANGNKIATAQSLHLQRRSVYYRLERIEELLGRSLDDPEQRVRLYLALRARELLETGRQF